LRVFDGNARKSTRRAARPRGAVLGVSRASRSGRAGKGVDEGYGGGRLLANQSPLAPGQARRRRAMILTEKTE
jgi:hypothetical protein